MANELDGEIESAWAGEVERRVEAIESAEAELIPAAASIARARAALPFDPNQVADNA